MVYRCNGAAVFGHLFKLPPRYSEHRPTSVISARLHGVGFKTLHIVQLRIWILTAMQRRPRIGCAAIPQHVSACREMETVLN